MNMHEIGGVKDRLKAGRRANVKLGDGPKLPNGIGEPLQVSKAPLLGSDWALVTRKVLILSSWSIWSLLTRVLKAFEGRSVAP